MRLASEGSRMSQRGSQPLYPIGIVAELVDVRPETLRVWDRDREGLVTPKRRRGFRCYSDADLQRALFVKHLLDEEGFNVAAVRGYIRLYHCWTLSDCVPCHEATTATGKPCWKRPGAYCGLAEEESRLCSTCSSRDSRATTVLCLASPSGHIRRRRAHPGGWMAPERREGVRGGANGQRRKRVREPIHRRRGSRPGPGSRVGPARARAGRRFRSVAWSFRRK
jgi:DNA-binding transcriptional MerR regulator